MTSFEASASGSSEPGTADTVPVGNPSSCRSPRPAAPQKLGRFIILEELGSGGMGRVYRAHDPQLDREVALKQMHTDSAKARKRIVREARAMARVVHPNVIDIYDVGEHDSEVFIAMELVRGETLRHWLREGPRGWSEVVQVFLAAGQGLAAAHAADLVHRDFKPDNVLLGENGRVRVLDFGLATDAGAGSFRFETPAEARTVSEPLTEAGTVLGTPSYMAPEQHRGVAADARSDQFSFCVALYEGLFRRRPFSGLTADQQRIAKENGQIVPAPVDGRAPRWLWHAIRRGLQPRPADRWPSMDALIEALREKPRRKGWGALLGASAVIGVLGVLFAATTSGPCDEAGQGVAHVWSAKQRTEVRRAFRATSLPYANETFDTVSRRLNAYVGALQRSHRDACEATRVRGEQPELVLDARIRCLQDRRRELAAAVRALADADASVVENALGMVMRLPAVDRCDDVDYVTAKVPPPGDPETQRVADEVRSELSRARAASMAGKPLEALPVARDAMRRAETSGYVPLRAEAGLTLADALERAGKFDRAETVLREALSVARRERMDELAAELLIRLVGVVGRHKAQFDEAKILAGHAEAAVERMDDPSLRASLHNSLGNVALAKGAFEEARSHYESALELNERLSGPVSLPVAATVTNLGNVASLLSEFDEALDAYQRALEIDAQLRGPEHPLVALSLNNIGQLQSHRGDLREAERSLKRSIRIFEQTLGPKHPSTAYPLNNLAQVELQLGAHDEALRRHEAALEIRQAALGPEHPEVGVVLNDIGNVYSTMGDLDAAARYYQKALTLWEAALGSEHPDVAGPLHNLANVQHKRGRYEEAIRAYRRVLTIWEKAYGPEHFDIAEALNGLGISLMALGRIEEARESFERALRMFQKGRAPASGLGSVQFNLARALWDAGPNEQKRAVALAREAHRTFASAQGNEDDIDAVEVWLDVHATEQ